MANAQETFTIQKPKGTEIATKGFFQGGERSKRIDGCVPRQGPLVYKHTNVKTQREDGRGYEWAGEGHGSHCTAISGHRNIGLAHEGGVKSVAKFAKSAINEYAAYAGNGAPARKPLSQGDASSVVKGFDTWAFELTASVEKSSEYLRPKNHQFGHLRNLSLERFAHWKNLRMNFQRQMSLQMYQLVMRIKMM